MRIIVRGKIKETEVTCGNCDTIFAYIGSDVEWIPRLPEKESFHFVRCPVCSSPKRVKE